LLPLIFSEEFRYHEVLNVFKGQALEFYDKLPVSGLSGPAMIIGSAEFLTSVEGISFNGNFYLVLVGEDADDRIDWDSFISPRELTRRLPRVVRRWREHCQYWQSLNPLSGLPGNLIIECYINENLRNHSIKAVMYLDLNHFKAFNDYMGFFMGDKVIQAMSRILKTVADRFSEYDPFIGHIGGDDFIYISRHEQPEVEGRAILEAFQQVLGEFYSPEEMARRYIIQTDRQGVRRQVPVLGLAIAMIDNLSKFSRVESLSVFAGILKKAAKARALTVNHSVMVSARDYQAEGDCLTGEQIHFPPAMLKAWLEAMGESNQIEFIELIEQYVSKPHPPAIRKSAIYGLGRLLQLAPKELRYQYLPVFSSWTENANPHIRMRAVEALAGLQLSEGVGCLLARFHDRNPYVIAAAIRSSAELQLPNALELTLDLVGNRHPAIREALISYAAQMVDGRFKPLLLRLLRLRNDKIKYQLMHALRAYADAMFLPGILSLIQKKKPIFLAIAALELLIHWQEMNVELPRRTLVNWFLDAWDTADASSDWVIRFLSLVERFPEYSLNKALIGKFHDVNPALYPAIIQYLDLHYQAEDWPFIGSLLLNSVQGESVTLSLIQYIKNHPNRQAVDWLRNELKSDASLIRYQAGQALIRFFRMPMTDELNPIESAKVIISGGKG